MRTTGRTATPPDRTDYDPRHARGRRRSRGDGRVDGPLAAARAGTRSRSWTATGRATARAPPATNRGSRGAATGRTATTRSGSAGRSPSGGSWSAQAGVPLFVPAGVVWLASEGQSFEAESLASLRALGHPGRALVPATSSAARVPVMDPSGVPWALFEPEAGALLALPAVTATIAAFEAEGGEVWSAAWRRRRPRRSAAGGGALDRVRLDDGRTLEADAFVFACGPWLPDLFPALLGEMIVPHRQDVHPVRGAGRRRALRARVDAGLDRLRGLVLRLPVVRRGRAQGVSGLARADRATGRFGARGRGRRRSRRRGRSSGAASRPSPSSPS